MKPFVPAALAAFALVASAHAQPSPGTTSLGGAKGWAAWAYGEKAKVCYLEGQPEKSEPQGLARGRVDLYVTHRPADKAVNVVEFHLGYAAKAGSNADLAIDGKKFQLFTDKESAWSNDAAEDKAVTEALGKGKRAILKATSARGTATTDNYSLDGFKDALAAIDKACNVKR
jgi:invasion protein IalB